jgi:hypothetical protein
VIGNIAPDTPLRDVIWGTPPFVAIMIVAVVMICIVPGITSLMAFRSIRSRLIQLRIFNVPLFDWRLRMRLLWSAAVAAGLLTVALAAFAQSNPSAPATPIDPAPAVPVAASKRFACQAATQGFKGQDKRDQMQLCMAQARLDCLKQAIDQKIVGPQRKEFVRSCAEE